MKSAFDQLWLLFFIIILNNFWIQGLYCKKIDFKFYNNLRFWRRCRSKNYSPVWGRSGWCSIIFISSQDDFINKWRIRNIIKFDITSNARPKSAMRHTKLCIGKTIFSRIDRIADKFQKTPTVTSTIITGTTFTFF